MSEHKQFRVIVELRSGIKQELTLPGESQAGIYAILAESFGVELVDVRFLPDEEDGPYYIPEKIAELMAQIFQGKGVKYMHLTIKGHMANAIHPEYIRAGFDQEKIDILNRIWFNLTGERK